MWRVHVHAYLSDCVCVRVHAWSYASSLRLACLPIQLSQQHIPVRVAVFPTSSLVCHMLPHVLPRVPPPILFADAYKVTEESTVVLAAPSPPLIKLDDKHYK